MNRPDIKHPKLAMNLLTLLFISLAGFWVHSAWAQNNLNLTSSERQQPVDIQADNTDGSLGGDGNSRLCGNFKMSQGSLVVEADCAEISYQNNRIASVKLTGTPATWNQTIPDTGPVSARASTINYSMVEGRVEFRGDAELHHPTGDLYGEVLTYDQQTQRFSGEGAGNGDQIRIRLESAVFNDDDASQENETGSIAPSAENEPEPQLEEPQATTGH